MAEDAKTRELIEAAVAEVFDQHVRALHDDVVGRVMCTIETVEKSRPERPVSEWLKSAIGRIESSGQQTDILKALLEGTAPFCERAAILVLRGATAVMWQGRGFGEGGDTLKTVSVDAAAGVLKASVHERVPVIAKASEVHAKFGTGMDCACAVVPLVIREKVAALLYCDGAPVSQVLDASALEMLAGAAGKWIELQAFRKTAGVSALAPAPKTVSQPVAAERTEAPRAEAVAKKAEGKVPVHAVAEAAAAPVGSPHPHASASAQREPVPELPPQEQELHKKARRFAKLLVDEIILYNRDKVSEGRRNHDIYDRLRDDIDKSRATYEKRYGDSSAAKFDYFRQAIIGGLAEHNLALLGSNFPR